MVPMKKLGELRWYSACFYQRDLERGLLRISQQRFAEELAAEYGVEWGKSVPLPVSVKLTDFDENEACADVPFRELVGSLMWLATQTRPDIANAVRAVARYCASPKMVHWKAALGILGYVRRTSWMGITFERGVVTGTGMSMQVFVDADYASKAADRRSVSGGLVMYGGGCVTWFSRTQKFVTLSTTEAAYVAIADVLKEVLFLRQVWRFMLPDAVSPAPLEMAVAAAANPAKTPSNSRSTSLIPPTAATRRAAKGVGSSGAPRRKDRCATGSSAAAHEGRPGSCKAPRSRRVQTPRQTPSKRCWRRSSWTEFPTRWCGSGDDGSSQPLHDPQLSIPSPFGQKPSDVECVPLTYKDVLNSKYKVLWEAAIAKEFDGHKKTGLFSEVSGLPEGRKAISAKWIFSHKTNEKGLIVDFKARMVARGFSQIPGVDFHHSSSACPSAVSIKTMVAVSTENGRRPVHWDIKQAYTHAKLKEEIYLRLPDGCGVWTGKAVKVERALYGLKQSGSEWGFEVADALISNGYEQCRVDPCIFRKVVDGDVVGLIVIYVDDIMFSATEQEREELLASLQKRFSVKDLGDCTWYDGCAIEVDLENGTTKLSQTAYIESMLNRFNVTTTAPTPAVVDDGLGPKRDDESSDKPVREAIGCLMWFLFTRPDIALPLNKLQKIAHSPTERMWNALVRIMSYLNETKDLGITYVRGSGLDLDVFVDSSYADSTVDRRSTTGLAVTGKSVPLSVSVKLIDLDENEACADVPFRELVGSLMWLATQTRPDIANAVRAVARYCASPKMVHWKAALGILGYVRRTSWMGITFENGVVTGMSMQVFVDADYASKAADRRSVSGGLVMCGGGCVTWFSRTQKCVTLSTTEAEYVAIADVLKEVLFLRQVWRIMLPDAGRYAVHPVFEDNQGAIQIAHNPISNSNSKHIDVRHYFIRKLVERKEISITHVFVDADYASKAADRRSVSGGLVMCGGGCVTWFSRTQKCITLSTTEAEYVAIADVLKEVLFLRQVWRIMLPDAGRYAVHPVFEDNQGAIQIAHNPISNSNSKHIDVRHYFIRKLVERKEISITHVTSEFQYADFLTKAISKESFELHRERLCDEFAAKEVFWDQIVFCRGMEERGYVRV
ncbi:unnamed protein product [Ectocarpus sp. CCAP 1310/34]|nr:unnamed protein product [Ectocarpus sp. CCAP 1310/34]